MRREPLADDQFDDFREARPEQFTAQELSLAERRRAHGAACRYVVSGPA
jgi:hypothetical protein